MEFLIMWLYIIVTMAVDTPRPSTILSNVEVNVTKLRKIFEPTNKSKSEKPPRPPISTNNKNSSGICCTNENDYELAEAKFNRVLLHLSKQRKGEYMRTNVITHQYERDNIIKYGNMLYEQDDYRALSLSQIYMVLIYTYYAMHLIEQYWDWLTFKHIRAYFTSDQYKIAMNLMYDISSGDILDCYGENISCKIRRSFMGLNKLV